MVYFGDPSVVQDVLLEACKSDLKNKVLLNFFKPMHEIDSRLNDNKFHYELYSESEWRIVYNDQPQIVDPRAADCVAAAEYYNSLTAQEQEKLKYLIPLDYHLGLVIYPSLAVKRAVRHDEEIQYLLAHMTLRTGEKVFPIEVDLDACRNF